MKKLFKRTAAILITAGVILSMTACGGNTAVALKANGNDVSAGEYILTQLSANSNAMSKFTELYPDVDTSAEDFDYYKQELEGVSFRDWVVNDTIETIKTRMVYSNMFDELGLSFTDEEKADIKASVNSTWDTEDSTLAYYGIDFKTWGLFYESFGAGKESYRKVYTDSQKVEKVFHAIYDTDGTKPVAETDVKVKYEEMYARYRMIKMELKDGADAEITDEAALKALEDMGLDYAARISAGESFTAVKADYTAYVAEQKRLANPDEEAEEDETEGAEETAVDENTNDVIVKNDSKTPSEEIVKKIFGMAVNKPELYKAEDAYYVLVRLDLAERDDWYQTYREAVLHEMKGQELIDDVKARAEEIIVEKNEAAIKRYDPKKTM